MTVFSKLTELNTSFEEYKQTQQQEYLEKQLSEARSAIGVEDTLQYLKNLTTGAQILSFSIDCTKLQTWLSDFQSLQLKTRTPKIDVNVLDKLRQIKEDIRSEREALIRKFLALPVNESFHSEELFIPPNQLTPAGQQLRLKLLRIKKELDRFIDDHQDKLPDSNIAYHKHLQNRHTLSVEAPRLATLTSDEARKVARAQAKQDIEQRFEEMRSEGITYDEYLELCTLITRYHLGHDYAHLLAKCRMILPSE